MCIIIFVYLRLLNFILVRKPNAITPKQIKQEGISSLSRQHIESTLNEN